MRCGQLAGLGAEHDPAQLLADRGVAGLEGEQRRRSPARSSRSLQQPRLGRLAGPLAALEADEDAASAAYVAGRVTAPNLRGGDDTHPTAAGAIACRACRVTATHAPTAMFDPLRQDRPRPGGASSSCWPGVAHYGGWNSVARLRASPPAPIGLLASLVGRSRRAARRPVRRRRDRRPAVRARQPARAVHLHLLAQGRAGGRGPGGPGRLDPGQPAAGARPRLPRRRPQARHPAARLGAGPHDRRADAAVGDRVGDPVARALRARAGLRARDRRSR